MTELRWDGKYDPTTGKKCAPLKIALPFQTVETVNESAQERQKSLDMFANHEDAEWRNRLIWGDKKYVLASLLPEFAGKVDLIYIDPPFDTGANFSFTATIPDAPEKSFREKIFRAKQADADPADPDPDVSETNPASSASGALSFTKEPSILEQKAYRDTWGKGLDSYLKWFYETAVLLRELLSEKGSIYVHLDYNVGHYAKAVMDEVLGLENFQNCIVWKRGPGKSHPKSYGHNTDYILFYTKSVKYVWHKQYTEVSEEYTQSFKEDERGRYVTTPLHSGKPAKIVPTWRGINPPTGRGWAYKIETLEQFDKEGKIEWSGGGIPRLKRYEEEIEGAVVQELWTDIKPTLGKSNEHFGYPTQKPEALLERIIKASSNPGDLVLDCFCGSGTTAAVSEKLNRRWITCDLGRFAIHTARKRLLAIPNVTPFIVQNLGKYERQHWQIAEFGDAQTAATRETAYRTFILDLYRARPLSGYVYLHGVKGNRRVFVGSVDSPISLGDLKAVALELKKTVGTGADAPTTLGVDILGWDFAFELNEAGKQAMADAGIDAKFVRIPREVLEKKAVEQGDIKFFELAALHTDVQVVGKTVTVTLSDFVMPADDVPQEVQTAITHWSQWIDYWAVDWDNKGDTFHNEWQDYRTRKKRDLQHRITHTYADSGPVKIVIKVIDILGNDTTKTVDAVVL